MSEDNIEDFKAFKCWWGKYYILRNVINEENIETTSIV